MIDREISGGSRALRRRGLLAAAGHLVLGVVVGIYGLGWSGIAPTEAEAQRAGAKSEFSTSELMKKGDLDENIMGSDTAPVTIIEYSSMTCPHCASFHRDVLPELKKKFIDTGKARLIMREFPLDDPAAAASMLARCSGPVRFFPLLEALFSKQKEWAFSKGGPLPGLEKIAKQAGFTHESFEKCLSDQKLLDGILWIRERAAETFGVRSTPTFFINGKKLAGSFALKNFEKAMAPHLPK